MGMVVLGMVETMRVVVDTDTARGDTSMMLILMMMMTSPTGDVAGAVSRNEEVEVQKEEVQEEVQEEEVQKVAYSPSKPS